MKVKFTLAILTAAVSSLMLTSCSGFLTTGVGGGGYYPGDPIYTGPILPPPAPGYPLPPVTVYPYPGPPPAGPGFNKPGHVRPPSPGINNPGNNRPPQPSFGNSGQGSRPMSKPAQSSSQQGSGATRTH